MVEKQEEEEEIVPQQEQVVEEEGEEPHVQPSVPLSKQVVLALDLRGIYNMANDPILKALKSDGYPTGTFKKIFQAWEEFHTTVLDCKFFEEITSDINNKGAVFTQQIWKYLMKLPDVKKLYSQSVIL